MTDIEYTRTHWSKGDVLTAEKLNNIENALNITVQKINGKVKDSEGNTTSTLIDAEKLASIADIDEKINALDVATNTGTTIQTITSITEANGKISTQYSDIAKATSSSLGLIQVNTNKNLTINENGILGVNDSPQFKNLIITDSQTTDTNDFSIIFGKGTFQALTNSIQLGADLLVTPHENTQPPEESDLVPFMSQININGIASVSRDLTIDHDLIVSNQARLQHVNVTGNLIVGNSSTTTIKGNFVHEMYGTYQIQDSSIPYNCPDGTFTGSYKTITLGARALGSALYQEEILANSSEITLAGASTNINTSTNRITGVTTITNLIANRLSIGSNNTLYDNSFIIGTNCEATGNMSIAHGTASQSKGICSIASGYHTLANGNYTIALGYLNEGDALFSEWLPNTTYTIGDKILVITGNIHRGYTCNTDHTSSTEFENSYWTELPYTSNYALMFGNGYVQDSMYHRQNILSLDWDGKLTSNIINAAQKITITNTNAQTGDNLEEIYASASPVDTPVLLRSLTAEGVENINGNIVATGSITGNNIIANSTVYGQHLNIGDTNNNSINYIYGITHMYHPSCTLSLSFEQKSIQEDNRYRYEYELYNNNVSNRRALTLKATEYFYQVNGNATPTSTTINYIHFDASGSISLEQGNDKATLTKSDIDHLHTLWNELHPST